jgi:hypothetical protein
MKQVLKWRHCANVAEIQRESLVALDSIPGEDFRQFPAVGALQGSLHPVTGAVL